MSSTEAVEAPPTPAASVAPELPVPGPTATAFVADPGRTGMRRETLGLAAAFHSPTLEALRKVMPRGKWHADLKWWTWPLTQSSCRLLRVVLGDRLTVSRDLNLWYTTEDARREDEQRQRVLAIAEAAAQEAELRKLEEQRALFGKASGGTLPPPLPGAVERLHRAGLDRLLDDGGRAPADRCQWGGSAHLRLPPEGHRLDVQRDGAGWLAHNRSGVLADEVGLGKSLTVLMAMLEDEHALSGPHLIVAPLKVAQTTWPSELAKWSHPGALVVPQWSPGGSGEGVRQLRARSVAQCLDAAGGSPRPVVLVVNHDALAAPELLGWLRRVPWASIVVDEAHQVLSTGHRGKGRGTRRAEGLMALPVADGQLRVALTGTPFAGRLRNAWGLLDFCAPGAAGESQSEFARALTVPAGSTGSGATLDQVAVGMEPHWSAIMQTWVLRRCRTAAQDALIERRQEVVEPTPRQRAQDDHWRTRSLWTGAHIGSSTARAVEVADGRTVMMDSDTGELLPDVIAAVTRRLQLSVGELDDAEPGAAVRFSGPSPKVDRVEELLSEWGLLDPQWWWLAGEHGKAIVASPWTSGLDLVHGMLMRRLPPEGVVRIDGRTSPADVRSAVEAFTAPRGPGVLLLSSQAGGAGLTLDQHCTRLVFLSEHWTHDVQTQVVGRIENRTWEAPREVVSIRSAGMLDSYLATRTEHQASTAGVLLELARS